jgi:putative ABC transport system substrate-binding protein
MRRIGVLTSYGENDPDGKARLAAFRLGLEKRGWVERRNVRFYWRFDIYGPQGQARAKDLLDLEPEAILAQGPTIAGALQRASRTVPIVFVNVADPIGAGLIASLARPGGNTTGLLTYEQGIAGKWMQMLKEIAPPLARAGLVLSPNNSFINYLEAAKGMAASLGIELVAAPVERDAANIERVIASFARAPNGGLVVATDATTVTNRKLIIGLAARHGLPAVYGDSIFVADGGLVSYATDFVEMFRQASYYVDRILRGDKPADLPVQAPVRYQTALNLKTAAALGITFPPSFHLNADEIIE